MRKFHAAFISEPSASLSFLGINPYLCHKWRSTFTRSKKHRASLTSVPFAHNKCTNMCTNSYSNLCDVQQIMSHKVYNLFFTFPFRLSGVLRTRPKVLWRCKPLSQHIHFPTIHFASTQTLRPHVRLRMLTCSHL